MKRIMGLGLCVLAFSATAFAGRLQFSLRFDELRAHSSALTGCYGTASYQYILPTIQELKDHRDSLWNHAESHGLSGFAWSSTPDPRRRIHVYVLDLKSGKVESRPKLAFPSPKGLVYCKCRRDDLYRCTPMALPALGRPFVSDPHIWADPQSKLAWHYRWHPICWNRAKPACEEEGKRLPTLSELEHARPRLVETEIGRRVRLTGKPVWSENVDVEDPAKAWAFALDPNERRLHKKSDCLVSVCVEPVP